jgi:hypothetical protein
LNIEKYSENGLFQNSTREDAGLLAGATTAGSTGHLDGVLKSGHELREFYDPDSIWGGFHSTYIWAGIINRMMMDLQTKRK